MANIRANPDSTVAANKPAAAVDSCFATNRSLIASGADVLGRDPRLASAGACTAAFPTFSTTRIVAGGSRGRRLRLGTEAVGYGGPTACPPWVPTAADVAPARAVSSTGVCDYTATWPARRLLDRVFRVVASGGPPWPSENARTSTEPGRTAAPALARGSILNDADERRAVAQLRSRARGAAFADGRRRSLPRRRRSACGHGTSAAARRSPARPYAIQVHGTRVPQRAG